MHSVDKTLNNWQKKLENVLSRPQFAVLSSTDLTLEQYRSYLLETFFHTRENPFSQVLCASHFPRHRHELFRKFVMHALSEVKHDQLALSDYLSIGGAKSLVDRNEPLPATRELVKYTFEIAQSGPPVLYLAYLYHVEHMPTQNGQHYVDLLLQAGVPSSAMTFLEEHVSVDVVHNRMMQDYLDNFLTTPEAEGLFWQAMDRAIEMHLGMIASALNRPLAGSESAA